MEVSTHFYEVSHGKKPRGQGYWAFALYGERNTHKMFWCTGLYSQARDEAKRYARRWSFSWVEVMP